MTDGTLQTGEAGPEAFEAEAPEISANGSANEDQEAQYAIEAQMTGAQMSTYFRLLRQHNGDLAAAYRHACSLISAGLTRAGGLQSDNSV
jgi:hypothetical protein